MGNREALHLFEAHGVELEYMIVDSETLAVKCVADELLQLVGGGYEMEVEQGAAPAPRIRSFRVLLTPLAYIHVGHIDVSRCSRCGAGLRVLAAITEPRVIAAILAHLETRAARAPPPVRH